MGKIKKIRCWGCDSLDVIGWGIRSGKQRFKCKNCGLFLTRTNDGVSKKNRFIWFKEWIEGKQTFCQISKKSGYSERTLKRYFYDYLSDYPTWEIKKNEKVNLLIDGTYFANKVCLVLYRSHNVKATLFYRLTDGEWFEELVEDLSNLTSLGIEIESVTCDGLSNILKAVRRVSPQTTIQRCLAHIQRETLTWLTKHPQSIAGQELRHIILKIHLIETRDQWGYWVVELMQWYNEHQNFVNQKSYVDQTNRYWFTHKSVRKSFIHIKRALPNMFHFIDNPNIPKTTNSLESYFGHLKQNISLHRGLSKEHFKNYIKWYLFFKNNQNK